jgi:transposase
VASPAPCSGLARRNLPELSTTARRRLKWIDWHLAHGGNVSKTCRHFSISRQTFYRWWKRYNPKDLRSLEDRPSRPRRCRQPTWTNEEIVAVRQLRERYPFWGKMKLVVLLVRQGLTLSASRVGRILAYLKRTRQLKEPLRRTSARRRQWKRQYATRKPRSYLALAPGDIVQLDTMDVRPEPGIVLKQFTTVDVVSRWSVPTIASAATALLASRALEELIDRTPFPIKAIQVDGGSEFMGVFEETCHRKGILLFELPPRSPKLNGRVERANRTYRQEFYDCSTATCSEVVKRRLPTRGGGV